MPIASGTEALYNFENALTDSSGNGRTLTQAGTIPFVTTPTPAQGIYMAGVFTDVNYGTAPAALRTAMSGLSAWTIEFYANTVSRANNPVIISWQGTHENFFQQNPTSLRWNAGGANNLDIATDHIGTGSNKHVALVCLSSSSRKIFIDNVERGSNAQDASLGTVLQMTLGRYYLAGGFSYNGYIDQLRFSSVARSSFPTVDTSNGSAFGPAMTRRRRR